jgi:hypothetical protein
MKRFVLALAMACIALPALAVEPTMERVVNLPQDANKPYLTIAGKSTDAKYVQVASWFKSNDALVSIKNESHFNALTTESVMFKARYAKTMPVTPIVRLQSPDGVVVFEAKGSEIPANASGLASAIAVKTEGCPWRRRRCEPEQEEAAPQEEAQPIVAPEPAKPEPAGVHIGVLLAVIGVSLAVGAGIGAIQYFKRVTHPRKK